MRKTLSLFILFIALSLGGIYFFSNHPSNFSSLQMPCPFCNPTIVDSQKFYEDDLVLALYSHKPIFPGHCLIIPKRHVERFEELTDSEMVKISQTIKKVHEAAMKVFGTFAYILIQKNGHEVGQSVPHVHFHYIPRKKGDDSTLKFISIKIYLTNFQKPINSFEMQEVVQKLKEAM